MNLIYTFGIHLYHLLLLLISPFEPRAKKMICGRKGWKNKLAKNIVPGADYAWFHCSSLGEFEQGRPLLERYKKEYPDHKIALTFFSPSGYEIRKKYPHADVIFYLPFDTPGNARDFLKILKPQKAFFIKYDFWPNYLKGLKKLSVDTYLVSGIFRKEQLFFKWYGKWYRNVLTCFKTLFLQDDASGKLLSDYGLKNWMVAGDTRFDRVGSLPASSFYDPVIEQFCNGNQVLVCGSTWPPDEEFVAGYRLKQNNKKLKYIIAPHQIDEKHIQSIEALFNGNSVRYTKANLSEVENATVLIIDTIGKLAFVYRFANVSYIGGGFGAGIHNTLEAAIYGVPIVFGPNYRRFKEACDLNTLGAAFSFEEPSELEHILNKLLSDAVFSKTAGNGAFTYATKMSGATSRIILNL